MQEVVAFLDSRITKLSTIWKPESVDEETEKIFPPVWKQ